MDISFPDRRQTNTDMLTEYIVVGFICVLFAGAVFRFSRILGVLFYIPLVYILGIDLFCSVSNRWREFQWSRAYRRRVSSRLISELVAAHPERYVLHVRFFRQISRTQSAPVCII